MIVVSDASPLAALSHIRQVELLNQLYSRVLIPEAVWQEAVVEGMERPGRDALLGAVWIKRQTVENRQLVTALLQDLDAGESEAIALAVELNADLLIMDERLGRRTAHHFGLKVVGVIGILVESKQRGLVPVVKPYLDLLRNAAGFRISDQLYQRVLTDMGEG